MPGINVAELASTRVMALHTDAGFKALSLVMNTAWTMALLTLNIHQLRPRLRMLTLYYFANRLNYLVVGTGNRSEIAVGYFTKFGDGGVNLLPLGNLVKSQVRVLASYLGIPQEIIDKPPSAGLWQGQTDEREMGLTYAELDRYLLDGEVGEEARRIEQMSAHSTHKRRLPPLPPF